MLSSISRLVGLVAIGFCVWAAPTRADVVIPLAPAQVVPVPLPALTQPGSGPQKILLHVCHPCTGCHYDVPVCLPACCEGAPRVCHHRTIIGCGRVVYEWCCGYRVVIRFPRGGGYRVVQG
jgi:hypothetical protein